MIQPSFVRAIFFIGLCALLLPGSIANAAAEIGQPAPPLIVTTLSGETFDLAARRGKIVIVNFWATWCAPCRAEMPTLDAFTRTHRDKGMEAIGISIDKARDREQVAQTMAPFGYPAALAAEAHEDGFGRPSSLPVTYVVDASGIVRAVFQSDTSVLTDAWLETHVLPLMAPSPH